MTNVLLVVFDTARADAFEPYGAPAGASPAVADLARRGRALEDVYATASWTLPSHASMFTGALPRELGLGQAPGETPLGAQPVIRGLADRLLPEVLRRAGWNTRAFTSNVWVSAAGGFDTGFDEFVNPPSDRQAALDEGGLRGRLKPAIEAVRGRVDDGASAAEATLRRWLSEWSGEPFFWFVNLMECHSPYLPPRPYGELGTLGRLRASADARRHLHLVPIWRTCLAEFDVSDAALERMRSLYAGAVRYMDDWLARVLEAMDARGVLDDTLVVVLSDHGENFGEGGLICHAYSIDARLTRVPVVVAGPGAPERLASLAELPGAIAEAVGLDDHPWQAHDLPPLPVSQFDPPGSPGDPRLLKAIEDWGVDEAGQARMFTPLTIASDGRLRLQRRGGIEELFDLAEDPLELHPKPPEGPRVAALRAALDHPAATAVALAGPGTGPAAGGADTAALEAQMRLLGYM